MLQTYVQSPNGRTRAAAREQRQAGPSTAAARAECKSEAAHGVSDVRNLYTEALDETRGQLMKRAVIGSVVTFCFLMATSSFAAADDVVFSSDAGNFIVFGGLSLANIKAQEFVYGDEEECTGADSKCSQLNWQSKGVTLFTLGADAQIDNDWSLKGNVSLGVGGNGHMVDTDWEVPGHDDWSHRSIHPHAKLDHYVAGAIELDRIIYSNETSSFSVGAGFRYTDVKWTDYGGSGIYSSKHGFRDQPVAWPDGARGISYRQKIPVGFLSLGGKQALGNLTISGGLLGGLSLGIRGIDDHWTRQFRAYDDMDPAPTIGATVGVNYALTPGASLYLSGSCERVFQQLGKSQEQNTVDGTRSAWEKDVTGANFESMSVSFGLKGSF
ncbi:omptin family outer membrane protease [Mesorhizobium sp. WSM2239]|uniref:Omptin family outer membrane protease n=2 Tax=unclassified Mesorhizobium TaxID=325217 RepID=A0AAU8D5Q0_9HYPH